MMKPSASRPPAGNPISGRGTPLAQPYQSVRQFEIPIPIQRSIFIGLTQCTGIVTLICVIQLKTETGADVENKELPFINAFLLYKNDFRTHEFCTLWVQFPSEEPFFALKILPVTTLIIFPWTSRFQPCTWLAILTSGLGGDRAQTTKYNDTLLILVHD